MTTPAYFPEANSILRGGPGESFNLEQGNDVADLPTYRDGTVIISCWRLTLGERLRALLFGRAWVQVVSPRTHPPVALSIDRTIFTYPTEGDSNG